MKEFNGEEIAKHNSEDSLWVIINGKVYDLTKFYLNHPGGVGVLMDAAGKDATKEFEKADHSLDSKDIMRDYMIGFLIKK
uniref:Cytochrome b5 heme-binding domain-containing protein n=1 Tax=Panagrolaimus superbus TaxID=310955 RepID=A0A914Z8W8_9BILA